MLNNIHLLIYIYRYLKAAMADDFNSILELKKNVADLLEKFIAKLSESCHSGDDDKNGLIVEGYNHLEVIKSSNEHSFHVQFSKDFRLFLSKCMVNDVAGQESELLETLQFDSLKLLKLLKEAKAKAKVVMKKRTFTSSIIKVESKHNCDY